jgi:hypothetical protein
MKYYIGFVVLLSLGCNQAAKQNVNKKADSTTTIKATGTTTYLEWDSVKLNGAIQLI